MNTYITLEPMMAETMMINPMSMICCELNPSDFPSLAVTMRPTKKPMATNSPYVWSVIGPMEKRSGYIVFL
jgi:hypothetical protein